MPINVAATLPSITAGKFIADRKAHVAPAAAEYYLATHAGFARVAYFRSNGWAVCPDLNGGFGLSFCCGSDTRLYTEADLVAAFGSKAIADLQIEMAGGHVATALDRRGV